MDNDAKTPSSAETAGVIAHPPVIYLAGLVAGLGLDAIWPLSTLEWDWARPAGIALIFLSVLIVVPAFVKFIRAGTNIPTNRPTKALVTDGIYRWSRNPIYLSMTVLVAGIGLAVHTLWVLVMLVPVWAVMRYGVIAREEAYLERRFGEDYRRYRRSVRRWI